MAMTVPIHKFSVSRCPDPENQVEWAPEREKWADELAARLQQLSADAKLGPVIVLDGGHQVIVGELEAFVMLEVNVPQIARPVDMQMPPAPARRR